MPLQIQDEETVERVKYYGDNVTIITFKHDNGLIRVFKEYCYHLREPSDFLSPSNYIRKVHQRQPPPPELLQQLGEPYSTTWIVTRGPMGTSVLCYDWMEGSHNNPTIHGWRMILQQVNIMHQLDYVHGDLLPRNVIFNNNNQGFVIDFDLTRKQGERYVEGFNYNDFQDFRHMEAQGGYPMLQEHDVYSLCQMSQLFFDLEFCWDDINTIHDLLNEFQMEAVASGQEHDT